MGPNQCDQTGPNQCDQAGPNQCDQAGLNQCDQTGHNHFAKKATNGWNKCGRSRLIKWARINIIKLATKQLIKWPINSGDQMGCYQCPLYRWTSVLYTDDLSSDKHVIHITLEAKSRQEINLPPHRERQGV